MNFFENITFRKTRTRSVTDVSCDNSINHSNLDGTTNSLPNTSEDENCTQIQVLKEQIEQLTMQLISAHEEINNLSIENSELKKSITEITSKQANLKKSSRALTQETDTLSKNSKLSTPRTLPKEKKKSVQNEMPSTQKVINGKNITSSSPRSNEDLTIARKNSQLRKTNKLCIVSANKTNKILPIAEETFNNYQICHYLSPNCGIMHLISDLHIKLKDFSKNDFCVIFIGEQDFRKSMNYFNLVLEIRSTLEKIRNTNITYNNTNYLFTYF